MMERISEDIKAAMKSKDKVRLEALRYVKKLLIENNTSKKPIDELSVVIAYAKQLKDATTTMPQGSDLLAKTEQEIAVLAEYLPQQLSEGDVNQLITTIIAGMESPSFGAIMKELTPQIKGKFDGKRASELVKLSLPQA